MTREQASVLIMEAKEEKGLTFEALALAVERHVVWTTAALLGQHPMDAGEAERACAALGLGADVARVLQRVPMRGSLPSAVPVDPVIYRFYEMLQVYGPTIKAIVNEKFGDGIVSAIDFEMNIDRQPDPKGDRVVVTLNGKFLPYKKW